MKKRIQKYLSGSNEGFSLVELIIVIAIMAILVGVVALAVIPYLEKSRESKDLQALDTLASAATTAVADAKVASSGSLSITSTGWNTGLTGDASKIQEAMKATLGEAAPKFSSAAAKDQTVTVKWDTKNNIVAVYVVNANAKWQATATIGNSTDTVANVAACQYNDHALFCISNVEVSGTATESTTSN